MMLKFVALFLVSFLCLFSMNLQAQEIREYLVKRSAGTVVIDGKLDEYVWQNADYTSEFVFYRDGAAARYSTRAQLLWDDTNLYVAFTMIDPDVWGEMINHDDHLWNEEVAEMFIDPDGDGLDYMELQVNALGSTLDLVMSKAYSAGGTANWDWTLEGFTVGVSVDGTLNDLANEDVKWVVECAIPFEGIAFSAPDMNFPPVAGDTWRMNVYRYNYDRTGNYKDELTGWNQTDNRGFHAPDKFGRIVFSDEEVEPVGVEGFSSLPVSFSIKGNYPNPFNPSTTVEFSLSETGFVTLDLFTITGQKVRSLVSSKLTAGLHELVWDGRDAAGVQVTSGCYLARLTMGNSVVTHRMLLIK